MTESSRSISNWNRTLKASWDAYLRTPTDQNQQKSGGLDSFLGLVLDALNSGARHIPAFSDMNSVSNILAGEFLNDVHRICCDTEDEEGVAQLSTYLLAGRGWVVLRVLNTIGVQGLACSRELGDLLVSLLPVCCKFTMTSHTERTDLQLEDMQSCFSHLSCRSSNFKSSSRFPELTEITPKFHGVSQGYSTLLSSWQHEARLPQRTGQESDGQSVSSDSESDSTDVTQCTGAPFKSLLKLPPAQVGAFSGILPAVSSEDEHLQEGAALQADRQSVRDSSALQVSILVLSLLKSLCYNDYNHAMLSKSLSLSALPQLTQFLFSAHVTESEEQIAAEGWAAQEVELFQGYLVRVIISVAANISQRLNGTSLLTASGAMLTLIEVAKLCLNQTVDQKSADEEVSGEDCERTKTGLSSVSLNRLNLVTDILQGMILLVHVTFQGLPLNPSFLNSALKLFNDIADNGGLELVERAIFHWEKFLVGKKGESVLQETAAERISQLVNSVDHMVCSLKKAKVEYIHTMKCLKRKHHRCEYHKYLHHHHDILGISCSAYNDQVFTMSDSYGSLEGLGSEADLNSQHECAIATIGDFLLQVYQDSEMRALELQILKCIEEAGLCCCMPPHKILKAFLDKLPSQSAGLRNYVLYVLSKVLLDQFGGSGAVQRQSNLCRVCQDVENLSPPNEENVKDAKDGGSEGATELSDSALSSSDVSVHEDKPHRMPKWRCVRQFQPLLHHRNESLSIQVAQHLLRLVSQGSDAFKQQLFSRVFLPTLQMTKQKFLLSKSPGSATNGSQDSSGVSVYLCETVVQYCLSALPLLLQSQPAQDLFLNYGGVKQLCLLLQVGSLRSAILKVFEVLIILDERKTQGQQTKPFMFDSVSENSTETMFHATRSTSSPSCTDSKRYSHDSEDLAVTEVDSVGIPVVEAFLSVVFHKVTHKDYEAQEMQQSTETLKNITVRFSQLNFSEPVSNISNISFHMERKAHSVFMFDLWEACHCLFVHSATFRKKFFQQGGAATAYGCLMTVLYSLGELPPGQIEPLPVHRSMASEFASKLMLVESTLGICLGCCKAGELFGQRKLSCEELMDQVRAQMVQSIHSLGRGTKALCDSLINTATAWKNLDDIIQSHAFAVMHLKRQDSMEEEDIPELSDSCKDSETCQTELGYEADSEGITDEFSQGGRGRKRSEDSFGSGGPRVSCKMVYPQLCRLALELLVEYYKESSCSDTPSGILTHVLLKLVSLLKKNPGNAMALYSQGVIEVLLGGFNHILLSSDQKHAVEQRLILDLFQMISQQALSAADLKKFLDLFKEDSAPLEPLLVSLTDMIKGCCQEPTYSMSHPVTARTIPQVEVEVRSISSEALTASLRPVSPLKLELDDYTSLIQSNAVEEAIHYDNFQISSESNERRSVRPESPIHIAVVRLPLRDSFPWPVKTEHSFSLSLWLKISGAEGEDTFGRRVQRRSGGFRTCSSSESMEHEKKLPSKLKVALKRNNHIKYWNEKCLHMLTVGCQDLHLEVWTDASVGSLIFRLVTGTEQKEQVLCESCVTGMFAYDTWQHLGLTYSEHPDGNTTNAFVSVVVDGYLHKGSSMEYHQPKLSKRAERECQLLLGHTVGDSQRALVGSWHLGNVMLFKGAMLNKEQCFYLFTLGPDACSLSQCDSSEPTASYQHYVTQEIIQHSGLAHDLFTGQHGINVQPLRESLVMVYSPCSPAQGHLYKQPAVLRQNQGAFKAFLSSGKSNVNPLLQQPTSIPAQLLVPVSPHVSMGLIQALEEIGGIGVFLHLYAKVVEVCSEEKQQCRALRLLFNVLQISPSFAQKFDDMSGYAMLCRIFLSDRCIVGYELLMVLLDACLSKPIMHYSTVSNCYSLDSRSTAVICDVHIITQLLLAWQVWEQGHSDVWQMAFQVLELLVREEHPLHEFNIKQLQNVLVVDKLCTICLERIQDAYPSLPLPICQSMVNIMRGMLGSPPDLHIVVTLCDFLLLLHPAASTYVNHTADGFYFAHKWKVKRDQKSLYSKPMRRAVSDILQPNASPPVREHHHSDSNLPLTTKETIMAWLQQPLGRPGKMSSSQSLPSTPMEEWQEFAESETASLDLKERGYTYPPVSAELSELKKILPDRFKRELDRINRKDANSKRRAQHGEKSLSGDSVNALRDSLQEGTMIDRHHSQSEGPGEGNVIDKQHGQSEGIEEGEWIRKMLLDLVEKEERRGEPETVSEMDDTDNVGVHKYSNSGGKGNWTLKELDEIPTDVGKNLCCDLDVRVLVHQDGTTDDNMDKVSDENGNNTTDSHDHNLISDARRIKDSNTASDSSWTAEYTKAETTWQGEESTSARSSLTGSDQPATSVVWDTDHSKNESEPGNESTSDGDDRTPPDEEGLVLIATGLLDLLCTVMVTLPDANLQKIQGLILKPEVLIVMANHVSAKIRTGVVKLLDMYFHRTNQEQMDAFLRLQGFHLLANQLHQHKSTRELVEACFTILFGRPQGLNEDCDPHMLQELRAIQKHAIVPVLALLEGTTGNTALCHNTICLLMQVFETVPQITQVMLENGLVETLCNVIQILNAETQHHRDQRNSEERCLLIEDIQQFLCIIAERMFSCSGLTFYQQFEDLLTVLHSLEMREIQIYGVNCEAVENVQNMQCHAVESVFDYITVRLAAPSDKYLQERRKTLAAAGSRSTLSQSELVDRFKKVLVLAVDLIIYTEPITSPIVTPATLRLFHLVDHTADTVPYHKEFARMLLEFLVKGIFSGMERSFFQKKAMNSVMWQAKDVLRMQFAKLLTHQLSIGQDLSERLFALEMVANNSRCRDLFKLIVHINSAGMKMANYLYDLVMDPDNELSRFHRDEADEVKNHLQACGITPIRPGTKLTPQLRASMEEDHKLWRTELKKEKRGWLKKKESTKERIMNKVSLLQKKISGQAMEVTQLVVKEQNQQRKKFIEHLKSSMTAKLQVKKSWQDLIQRLGHERAVWYSAKSYPLSWQLDPTEGPMRERRRLQRCHLAIPHKFVSQDFRKKLETEQFEPPLSYLFEDDHNTSDSAALIYRLYTNEKIQHTCTATSVTPSSDTKGEILVGESNVYFVGDEAILDANYTQVLLGNKDLLSITLPHEDIKEIHKRWYVLKDNALEIFLTNGKTYLFSFETTGDRDKLNRILDKLELPNLIKGENLPAIQQLWIDGRMTNFEYLTHLNKMAGRSFNDLMQYPVFPFILANYDSDELNLEDSRSFRCLSKPVAVQDKSRESKYIENYKWLEMEKKKFANEPGMLEFQPDPYHYGSHYSNSGTVLHFLVRLPPFTQMFVSYQDQNFDLPDRTFHSMSTSWHLASFQSTTDVKELIPEFFFLPDFLRNSEGFHFGVRQTGQPVWDVNLPQWCNNNARLFILIHRQVLESQHVTQWIQHWIDLVFGFKQTGKSAVDAINVFHPATYFGIDVDSIADPVRRNAIKTMIKTYGQTPKQLFLSPHPQRHALGETSGLLSQLFTVDKSPIGSQIKVTDSSPGVKSPLRSVKGLRWGNFVGSPDCPTPAVAWRQLHPSTVASLVALPTGAVFGLGPNSCLLVMYSKEKDVITVYPSEVVWACIVSWGYPDNIVRVKNKKGTPPVNFLHWPAHEQVTCCASVPDCRLLFLGSTSGVLSVFNSKFNPDKQSNLQVFGQPQCLYGHSAPITALHVCKQFSILVSASQDTTCIIWDLNRLTYVRSITDHQVAVQAVYVSDTMGDIASVSHTADGGSILMLHTVNAQLVASLELDQRIHCLTISDAPEGRSVNVVAGGLSDGTVRLWSTWDLASVRHITTDKFLGPIISLTFSHDAQRLYASNADGEVVMWEKPSQNKVKDINFILFP